MNKLFLATHLSKKRFILINNAIPIVVALDPGLGPIAISLDQRPISQNALELISEIKLVLIRYPGITNGLEVRVWEHRDRSLDVNR